MYKKPRGIITVQVISGSRKHTQVVLHLRQLLLMQPLELFNLYPQPSNLWGWEETLKTYSHNNKKVKKTTHQRSVMGTWKTIWCSQDT